MPWHPKKGTEGGKKGKFEESEPEAAPIFTQEAAPKRNVSIDLLEGPFLSSANGEEAFGRLPAKPGWGVGQRVVNSLHTAECRCC